MVLGQVCTHKLGDRKLLIRSGVEWDLLIRLLRVILLFPQVGSVGVDMVGSVVIRVINSLLMLRFIMSTENSINI